MIWSLPSSHCHPVGEAAGQARGRSTVRGAVVEVAQGLGRDSLNQSCGGVEGILGENLRLEG